MKVLVLGGTVFLSKAVVQEFLDRGHDVTCLSRSADQRGAPGANHVVADRARGVEAYDEVRTQWDEVVDVATDPRWVRDALSVLGDRSRHWTYVSSCSVYADQDEAHCDETRPTLEPLDDHEVMTLENYGASKAAAEKHCRQALQERLLVVRAGLIVGKGDQSDRGGYWPARFSRDESTVLIPEALELWTQMIDVGDLASWMVTCAQNCVTGTFNAMGAARPLSEAIREIREVTNHRGDIVLAGDQWLVEHGVAAWAGEESLPLWIPRGMGFNGFCQRSNQLAVASGLVLRPFKKTLADIVAYEFAVGVGRERRAGLSPRREAELVALVVTQN